MNILSDWRWSWEIEMAQEIDWKENNNRRRQIIIATGELDFWKGTDPLLALYGAPFSFWISGPFSFSGGLFRRWWDCLSGFRRVPACAGNVPSSEKQKPSQCCSKFTVCFSFHLFWIFFPQETLVFIVKVLHVLVYVWVVYSPSPPSLFFFWKICIDSAFVLAIFTKVYLDYFHSHRDNTSHFLTLSYTLAFMFYTLVLMYQIIWQCCSIQWQKWQFCFTPVNWITCNFQLLYVYIKMQKMLVKLRRWM